MRIFNVLFFLVLNSPLIAWADSCDRVTNLREISIYPGLNKILNFDNNGHNAQIVWLKRNGEHALNRFNVFLFIVGESINNGSITLIENEHTINSVITDAPYDGEQAIRSVRFAHGSCDGRTGEIFLVTALRNGGAGPYDESAKVRIEIL